MILIITFYNHIVLCTLIVGVVSSGAGTTDFNFGLFSSGEDNVFLVMMAMMMTMMMILIMAIMTMMIMIMMIVMTMMLCGKRSNISIVISSKKLCLFLFSIGFNIFQYLPKGELYILPHFSY